MTKAKVKRFKPRDEPTPVPLPATFTPKFWQDQDHRIAAVKRIREMVEVLSRDAGADSCQKQMLCERASFICLRLQSAEVDAVTSGAFDPGVYAAMTNTLLGVLKALGLERKVREGTLVDYLESKK